MNPAVQNLPLRDIHLPAAVSWWPPAIGWWVLLLIIILLFVAVYLLFRKLTRPVIKKSAKAELKHLVETWRTENNRQALLQNLSILLRRIGISYLPRSESAGITGKRWYQMLNSLVKKSALSDETIELLVSAPYRPTIDVPDAQIEQLLSEVQQWVNELSAEARH